MAAARPAAGGGRWLEVDPDRIVRWLAGFGERHGGVRAVERGAETVVFRAADGAVAECHVPFPPLRASAVATAAVATAGAGRGADEAGRAAAELAAHAAADRLVGVFLVRLGGYAVGAFDGERLVISKTGSRPVHGRSSAGGWSQR
ncbi:MAG TPA: Vms1/Ankzf1 family peptidyl-tRNA hydrolase, partial [Streptosporangiaceae bacterium]